MSRIKERIKDYQKIGIGYLPNHSLRFHKKSKDSSGKANAYFTGKEEDKVWGIIGLINAESKKMLDEFEGLGKGYNEKEVEIIINSSKKIAITYIADAQFIDEKLVPFDWYREFVLQGGIENQLPEHYLNSICEIQCIKDKNTDRREKNYKIIQNLDTKL